MNFTKRIAVGIALLVALAGPAPAHDGPAFPIIVDKPVGPFVISLWTHPDIGTGSFWVILDPPRGGKLPSDVKVQVAVQPVSGRIPERIFDAPLDDSSAQVQYKSLIPFDRQEFIRVRAIAISREGRGEASASVEVTPVGPKRWELFLYLTPFLGVGFLWFRAVMGRRKRRGDQVK